MPTAAAHPDAADRALRVLVVDDEYEMRYLTKAFLEHAFPGLVVIEADSGAKGLRLLDDGPVDAIVSDYRMPRMDGLEFLVRACKHVPASACILMTAYADKELQKRAQEAGMTFIEKGGDPENVVEAVGKLLVPAA